ncbi:MAG: hypothetical protein K6G12_09075 [Lachnospiraceae bacterium]|nr:hypothetical protein [Lachnospiraceae bacterium]
MSKKSSAEKQNFEYILYTPYDTISEADIPEFFSEVHTIDVEVYSAEDAGEIAPMIERYRANTESYIYVREKSTNKLAGYINFFPVEKDLKDAILSDKTEYALLDDAISAKQVAPYRADGNFIYVLSAAISEEYRNSKAIRLMTKAFKDFMLKKQHSEGCKIESLAACAVSGAGQKILYRLGYHEHHKVSGTDDKFIFICDNTNDEGYLAFDNPNFVYDAFWLKTDDEKNIVFDKPYIKTWHDDVHLYLPMTEHVCNDGTDIFFLNNSNTNDSDDDIYVPVDPDSCPDPTPEENIPEQVLDRLKDAIRYECSSVSIRDMKVHYIGCYDFLHTIDTYQCADRSYDPVHDYTEPADPAMSLSDIQKEIRENIVTRFGTHCKRSDDRKKYNIESDDEELVVGLQKGYVFITSHRPTHMYVVNIFFPDYKYSTTQLEDQVSNNYIKIMDPRFSDDPEISPENIRFIRLYDYLWEKYRLHKCGQEKIMLCMSCKPDEGLYKTEFQNIMSAEAYNSSYQTFHINSKKLKDICETDHSQYDYYKVYLSDKVIAFILNEFGPLKERIAITSTYSFIAELIMFQNTALARMNNKVSDLLYRNNSVTMEEVMELEQEYGKTIPFWEPSNFKYTGTAEEATCIKKAFSNDELLETYNKHQDYLEHMVDLMSSERENRNSMILNIAATVLAVIQIESFITDILGRFYEKTGIGIAADYVGFNQSFNHTLLGGLLLIIIYLIIRNNRKKKEHRFRERKTDNR